MTDNPWDELNESDKKKSTDKKNSVVDFFGLSEKNSNKKKHKNTADDGNYDKSFDDAQQSNRYDYNDNDDFLSNLNQLFNKIDFPFKIKKNFQLFICGVLLILFFW